MEIKEGQKWAHNYSEQLVVIREVSEKVVVLNVNNKVVAMNIDKFLRQHYLIEESCIAREVSTRIINIICKNEYTAMAFIFTACVLVALLLKCLS